MIPAIREKRQNCKMANAHILRLPAHLMCLITQQLSLQDNCSLERTCKALRRMLGEPQANICLQCLVRVRCAAARTVSLSALQMQIQASQ